MNAIAILLGFHCAAHCLFDFCLFILFIHMRYYIYYTEYVLVYWLIFDRCYVLCSQKRSACITFKLQSKIVSKVQKSTKEIHVYTTISESAIWQKDASAFTCLQSSRRLAHNGTWLCIPAKWQMTVSFSRQVTDTLWYTNKLFYWNRAEKSLIFVEERHISTLLQRTGEIHSLAKDWRIFVE